MSAATPEEPSSADAGRNAPTAAGLAPPLIEFRGVAKRFGAFAAVDGVDLAIAEGEFFALLGPSGCGKTTLLRLLAGFERPSAGTVAIGGVDLADAPPHRRPVNMMFQSYALFPHMTVERNIAFGLKMEGMDAAARKRRVEAMLALVQMESFGRRMPHQLSGGQRQRVALARALAKQPKVLLLDEPLSALDKKLRQQTRFELARIHRELGITFVLVTHDQEEALALSDRIAVMNRGRIEQVATPAEIYRRPNSRYVADFIGSINILEAVVVERCTGGVRLDAGGTKIDLQAPCGDLVVDQSVWFAIRPEDLKVAAGDAPALADNSMSGVLRNVAYLGERSILSIDAGSRTILASISVPAPEVGARVQLSWPRSSGLLLRR